MNRIFHIFRKDAIRLWPRALVFFALLAAYAWVERWYGRDSPNQQTLLVFLTVLVPFACSVLLIALIHQERLVGDRQYWLSRPISRSELIAAKILFILAFVNLPVFVYQAYMVATGGLPLLQNWSNFLWLQLFFTVVEILPVVALGSVTKNLAQALLAILTAAIVFIGFFAWLAPASVGPVSNMAWIEVSFAAAALALGSVVVLLRQYNRRGAILSRLLLVGTIALTTCSVLVPYSVKREIQMRVSPQKVNPNEFRISWAQGTRLHGRRDVTPGEDPVSLELPIDVDQPTGISVHAEALLANVAAPSGVSQRLAESHESIRGDGGAHYMIVNVDHAFYDRVKDTPVQIYGVLDFTVLANGPTIPLPGHKFVTVPGIGICSGPTEVFWRIGCNSLLPKARVQLIDGGRPGDASPSVLAPYPFSAGYPPITTVELSVPEQLRDHPEQAGLMIQTPLAYIRRPFDFDKIILADYAVTYTTVLTR